MHNHLTFLTRWTGTASYLIGMVLTAINVYPINLVFGAIGGLSWCLVGMSYKDKALIVVELAAFFIYIYGLIYWSLT